MRVGLPGGGCVRRSFHAALIGLLVVAATAFPQVAPLARARAEGPPPFLLPAESSLDADRALDLPVGLATTPDVIEVDPALEAAGAAFNAFVEDEWELDPLVERLGTDPEAAFRFVRDSIAYQPYPGMLRGAQGTLAARGGSAYDRALLLKELLVRQGHVARLALADLDAATTGVLLERSSTPPAKPFQSAIDVVLGPGLRESMERRARRDYAQLRAATDAFTAVAGEASPVDLHPAVSHHAWVQLQTPDGWLDLDPSLPDAKPGETLTTAGRFYDEVLPIDRQAVTLRLVVETLQDGWLSEAPVLEQRFDAADAAGQQLLLMFQHGDDTGGGLFGGVGTPGTFTPILLVDGTPVVGSPFAAAPVDGDGGFADFGGFGAGASGDLTAIFLEAAVSVPGRPDAVHRRVLLDRVPPDARLVGTVTPEVLAPLASDESGPLVLGGLHHIMVSNGGADPRAYAYDQGQAAWFAATELVAPDAVDRYPIDALLWPMTVNDRALVVLSEHAVAGALVTPGGQAFIGSPRIFVVSLLPEPTAPYGLVQETDLLVDAIQLTGSPSAADRVHMGLWYGALESALETELAIRAAPAYGVGPGDIDSVSLRDPDPEPVLLLPDDLATLPAEIPTGLRRELEQGRAVVRVGTGVPLAWWSIGRSDGATRAVVDPGLGMSKIGRKPPTPGGGQHPPGGGPKPLPKPPVTPPEPPVNQPMQFPDEFVKGGPKPAARTSGKEESAVTSAVAIPATHFLRKYSGVILVGIMTEVAMALASEMSA